jgi:ankyrin repeat protein
MDDDVKFRQPGEIRDTGNSKLHEAAWRSDVAQIKAIIAEIPDSVHTPNRQGEMPLHQAAKFGNRETIETLIAAGAQVNARSRQGDTPLHLAAWASNDEGMKALMRAGADKSIKNVSGQKPIDLAIQRGRKREMIAALKSAGTDKKMAFLDWMKSRGQQQQPQTPSKEAAPVKAPQEQPKPAQPTVTREEAGRFDHVKEQLEKATMHMREKAPVADETWNTAEAMRQKQNNQEKVQAALSPTDGTRGKAKGPAR